MVFSVSLLSGVKKDWDDRRHPSGSFGYIVGRNQRSLFRIALGDVLAYLVSPTSIPSCTLGRICGSKIRTMVLGLHTLQREAVTAKYQGKSATRPALWACCNQRPMSLIFTSLGLTQSRYSNESKSSYLTIDVCQLEACVPSVKYEHHIPGANLPWNGLELTQVTYR